MPRKAREKSESGMYHIIMRGINRQTIFEDEEDCSQFLQTLQRYKATGRYQVYAYCFMGNHVIAYQFDKLKDLQVLIEVLL